MRELERFAATRVRRGGKNDDCPTDNTVTAVFRHDTSRALDPHLHSHGLMFNATFDPEETRWKGNANRGNVQGTQVCGEWEWLLVTDGQRFDPWEHGPFYEDSPCWKTMRAKWDRERAKEARN